MCYEVLIHVSTGYPSAVGRLHTRYAPVRRSPATREKIRAAPRLACIRPAASVHPEPGSNSPLYYNLKLLTINSACVLCALYFYPELTRHNCRF